MYDSTVSQLRHAKHFSALLASAVLAAPLWVRADSLAFNGGVPAAPHILLDLTASQRAALASAGKRQDHWPEITLSVAQRRALRAATGADVRWLFAVRKEAIADGRTDGAYNFGVIAGPRLAVLLENLGDYLSNRDLLRMAHTLVRPALPRLTWAKSPVASEQDLAKAQEEPAPLRDLIAHSPAQVFARRLELGGWTAQRLRLAGVPRARDEDRDIAAPLHTLSSVATQPLSPDAARWPDSGARLEADGRVYLLLPGLVEHELGPRERAWFLLAYVDGKIAAAMVLSEDSTRRAATYDRSGIE